MSIQYLLDGYNIIPQMKVSKLSDLEDQRKHLIGFIEQYSPQGSPKNGVTVVFDGNKDHFGTMGSRSVKVVFTQGETADEKIKEIVTRSETAKNIVVVSDDRSVQYAVRALGAKACSVRAFLDKAKSSKKKDQARRKAKDDSPVSGKYISKSDESKITSEMGEIWLKPDVK